jgi:maleylacetoacetate isomerase
MKRIQFECQNPAHTFFFMGCTGIDYEYKAINILTGEQFSEEFTKLSPFQTVPVLEIDGVTLVDSVAILLYLEERFPDKRPLLPKDLVQRAHIHQVVFLIASNIQPLQNTQILPVIEAKLGKEERLKWAQDSIAKGFNALERILEKTAGKYCFGDMVTLVRIPFLCLHTSSYFTFAHAFLHLPLFIDSGFFMCSIALHRLMLY